MGGGYQGQVMAGRPARAARVVLCGVLVAALVVGVGSLGSAVAATGIDGPGTHGATADGSSLAADGPSLTADHRSFDADRLADATRDEHDESEEDDENASNGGESNATDGEPLEGFDGVKTTFDVSENGSATVTVVYRYRIEGNESAAAWADLRADIDERQDAYVAAETERWNGTLEAARNATDREMNVSSFSVGTGERTTPRELGEVEFTFRWSGFAAVEPARLVVGDALDGYVLDEGTELWIAWPEDYELQGVEPEPDEPRAERPIVGWRGADTDFVDGEPRLQLLREGESRQGASPVGDGGVPMLGVVFGAAFLLVIGAIAAWWLVRPEDDPPAETDDGGDSTAVFESPPTELLSNEERVLALLADNAGRMKQQAVVAELGWTEAKTSQVVGRLRENGEIEVFRVGRENVLALPDEEREADAA